MRCLNTMWWLAAFVAGAPSALAHVTIQIDGMKFVPPKVEIKAGETVTWEDKDLVPHTVTSKVKEFDSGIIYPGGGRKSRFQHTFRKKGDFAYSCNFHPVMHGEITVK